MKSIKDLFYKVKDNISNIPLLEKTFGQNFSSYTI